MQQNVRRLAKYFVLSERGKFGAKIFSHYTDIVILVLGHFIATHPVDVVYTEA